MNLDAHNLLQAGLLLSSLYTVGVAGWLLVSGTLRETAGGVLLLVGAALTLAGSLAFQGIFLWPGVLVLTLGAGVACPVSQP